MRIVPILEDELLIGYRGRLANLNNCRRVPELQALMKAQFPVSADDSHTPFAAHVAVALELDVRTVVDRHTVWPLFVPFPERDAAHVEDRKPYGDATSHLWMKSARSLLALCPQCVADDLANPDLNLSYWRRSHQIPGLLHCPRHGEELLFVEPPDELGAFPADLLEAGQKADSAAAHFARTSPIAERTVRLLLQMLLGRQARDRQSVMEALSEQTCKLFGIDNLWEATKALGKRMEREVERSWLTVLMPHYTGATHRPNGAPVFLTAALANSTLALSSSAAALVAALVFDSLEQASEAMLEPQ